MGGTIAADAWARQASASATIRPQNRLSCARLTSIKRNQITDDQQVVTRGARLAAGHLLSPDEVFTGLGDELQRIGWRFKQPMRLRSFALPPGEGVIEPLL